MGTPEFAIPSLKAVSQNTDLKLIFTKEDKRNARGNKIIYSPVKQFGLDNDIEVIQPKRMKDEEVIAKIKEINPDLIVVVAYGKILPKEIIDIPKYGIINVHSSLLPKYRGASPIHSAILNGDKESGVSIMYIEEGLDSGDVILKETCEITEDDTLGTLHDRLKELGAIGLEKALKLIEAEEVKAEKQDDSKATFVKPITKEQAKIDWNNAKEVIFNQIRGLNPFPGAYTHNEKNENIKIYKSEKLEKEYDGENGTVVEMTKKGVDEAKALAEQEGDVPLLFLMLPDLHESLAGIVAGRIREAYYRPCFILTNGEGGSCKASGRSIPGYPMAERLEEQKELLLLFGGHPMAAGFSVARENVSMLKKALLQNAKLQAEDLEEKVWIDVVLPFSYLKEDFVRSLSCLEPFGRGNEKPAFAQKNVLLKDFKIVGKNKNAIKLYLEDEQGTRVEGVLFEDGEKFLNKKGHLLQCPHCLKSYRNIQLYFKLIFYILAVNKFL